MGKRARRGGIANKAVRAARAASVFRDDEAAAIAQRVYGIAVDEKVIAAKPPIDMAIYAPLVCATELAAQSLCRAHGIPETATNINEIAGYLTAVFVEATDQVPAWIEHRRGERPETGGADGTGEHGGGDAGGAGAPESERGPGGEG